MNPTLVDFHCHSTASDGSLEPSELVRLAHKQGVKIMALTDHDSLNGLTEAQQEALSLGLTWVNGIEISAKVEVGHLHLLGYGFDLTNKALISGLALLQEARAGRGLKMMERLSDLNLPVELSDLELLPGASLGRPHLAQAMIKKGYVQDFEEAFYKYLGRKGPAFVDKEVLDPAQAIGLIREAGGIAVVAHPVSLKMGRAQLFEYLQTLKTLGLEGVEAYNSSHSANQCNRISKMALELDLFITGGSDFHGLSKPRVKMGRLQNNRKILSKWISSDLFDRLGIN
ncbi:MAG: hypothetical protein A2527_06560 [Candidatus Lambdaproteobacteria bacterium RIFOXYD2_FULL_50_16]|uniref:Polymerase/histidinol phosphatase N-terminal domain-containing protein n=1 Tax=Candidatus Lambdaproteobacteria bacterium RIFOXYD2_FULL_50_16 TaxID=1817772 RepID=A0A1F6GA66_9PROT|nr:MAG: hypothetical protein A2527_06560 [Candidatus Lambdaproteobacteria bacterium RIFOXYD2_FULL_50_16]